MRAQQASDLKYYLQQLIFYLLGRNCFLLDCADDTMQGSLTTTGE